MEVDVTVFTEDSSVLVASKSTIFIKAQPPDSIEVDVVVVVAEEEKGEPGLKSVNWDDEQDPDNPALLRGVRVVPGGLRCTMRTLRQKYVTQQEVCGVSNTYSSGNADGMIP